MKTSMQTLPKRTCGAHSRQTGQPCKNRPLAGKNRCRMHGGKTPKGTKGNRAHGLYSAGLSDEEQALWNDLKLGSVDDELRLCRIQLHRAMTLAAEISQDPNTVELAEVRRSSDEAGQRTDTVSKRPDVFGRMNWLLGRIAQLEKTRAELIQAAQAAGEGVEDTAQRVAFALRAMVEVETKQAPEDDDD